MQDFEKAPYLELDNYKAPEGINSIFIPMKDGLKIRLIYWNYSNQKHEAKGTILLQQGHNEFIEKYYETIQDFLNRKYNVIAFDWRGQGISERMINDNRKQYIEDFELHNQDLKFIIDNIIIDNFTKPLIGIGHSMGGCILLYFLKENEKQLDKVILSAPMLGFRSEKFLMPMIEFFSLFLPKKSFFPGSKPNYGKETPFKGNDLTTDRKRYKRTQKMVRLKKDIRLWGITIAWVKAVKKILLYMRQEGWAETIKSKILFINSLNDKVVSSKYISIMSKRLNNSKMVYFKNAEHELFMESDNNRKKLWESIDLFLK